MDQKLSRMKEYLEEQVAQCAQARAQLMADYRGDEANFQAIQGNVYGIFSTILKVAVEQNLCNHILASDTDMDQRIYELMRGRSVREVNSTNGRISFKEVLDFQKSV